MQLLQDLRRQRPQLRIPLTVQMRLQLALRDPPLATPDHEPHLLYAYFAHHALAVRVQVGSCREVAVGLDAPVEELAQEPYNAERRTYDFRHGSPLVPGDAN